MALAAVQLNVMPTQQFYMIHFDDNKAKLKEISLDWQ